MTLRTFFKNLFAPNSETKRLYTPLDLRLLEHYKAWQKKREAEELDSKRTAERMVQEYEASSKEHDYWEAKEEAERRYFDQKITQSTCLRAATVEDYNEWLTDWVHTGERLHYFSENPFSAWQLHYVQDPDTWLSLSQDDYYGISFPKDSRYLFIIPKQYDCRDYLSAFCVENNAVYGWHNNNPEFHSDGYPYSRNVPYVPAFTDTINQQMCQRAQATLDNCTEGERPEVDPVDLRVFQDRDAYMRRFREEQARRIADGTACAMERAEYKLRLAEAEHLEEQTLSKTDRVRPATCAEYDRWLEAWVRAGNNPAYYSDSEFNKKRPNYYYVIDPEAEFYISDSTANRFIIPEEYDCRDYLYKFCPSPDAEVYGWVDNKPVIYVQRMDSFGHGFPGGYTNTVDAQLRRQARLKYRQEQ